MGTAIASLTFITVVWIVIGAYKSRLAFHQRKLELAAQQAGAASAGNRPDEKLDGRFARLEERLRVLERIATDRHTDRADAHEIAQQIEALREPLRATDRGGHPALTSLAPGSPMEMHAR